MLFIPDWKSKFKSGDSDHGIKIRKLVNRINRIIVALRKISGMTGITRFIPVSSDLSLASRGTVPSDPENCWKSITVSGPIPGLSVSGPASRFYAILLSIPDIRDDPQEVSSEMAKSFLDSFKQIKTSLEKDLLPMKTTLGYMRKMLSQSTMDQSLELDQLRRTQGPDFSIV